MHRLSDSERERRTVRIERWPAGQESHDENAQGPDVGGETVRITAGYFSAIREEALATVDSRMVTYGEM